MNKDIKNSLKVGIIFLLPAMIAVAIIRGIASQIKMSASLIGYYNDMALFMLVFALVFALIALINHKKLLKAEGRGKQFKRGVVYFLLAFLIAFIICLVFPLFNGVTPKQSYSFSMIFSTIAMWVIVFLSHLLSLKGALSLCCAIISIILVDAI